MQCCCSYCIDQVTIMRESVLFKENSHRPLVRNALRSRAKKARISPGLGSVWTLTTYSLYLKLDGRIFRESSGQIFGQAL